MDLATDLTGGWGWLSSAPHAGLKPVEELETARSREFLQVGRECFGPGTAAVCIPKGRWTITEQWGEMISLHQG